MLLTDLQQDLQPEDSCALPLRPRHVQVPKNSMTSLTIRFMKAMKASSNAENDLIGGVVALFASAVKMAGCLPSFA